MNNCFTCGSHSGAAWYSKCPKCRDFYNKFNDIESANLAIRSEVQNLDRSTKIQTQVLESFRDSMSSELSATRETLDDGFRDVSSAIENLGSIVEWGLEGLRWEALRQTSVLDSISHTLKTPNQTQAEELRQMAESLSGRAMDEDAYQRFSKASDLNPLDFRIYFGLGIVLIKLGNVAEANRIFEKALLCAPDNLCIAEAKRYIGRIHFSCGEYEKALSALEDATALAPDESRMWYNAAQYASLLSVEDPGMSSKALSYATKAFVREPNLTKWAQHERNFEPLRSEIDIGIVELFDREKSGLAELLSEVAKMVDQINRINTGVPGSIFATELAHLEVQYEQVVSDFNGLSQDLNILKSEFNQASSYVGMIVLRPKAEAIQSGMTSIFSRLEGFYVEHSSSVSHLEEKAKFARQEQSERRSKAIAAGIIGALIGALIGGILGLFGGFLLDVLIYVGSVGKSSGGATEVVAILGALLGAALGFSMGRGSTNQ